MTSILISSNDPGIGDSVAARLAEVDGYRHVERSLLPDVAERFEVPLEAVQRALDPTASRKLSAKERALLLSYIQVVTLEALVPDKVVCTGLAAHLYVTGVSHVLQLRILSNSERRIETIAEEQSISLKKARKVLEREAASSERWSMDCFGVNERDAALYDIVLHLDKISEEKVVQIIQNTAAFRGFQSMTYSRQCLVDLLLASKVRCALLPEFSELRVSADGERAIVHVKCSKRQKVQTVSRIKELARKVENVSLVEVHTISSFRDLDSDAKQEVPPSFSE